VHGKRAKCYAEANIKVNGRYNGKYILVSAFFMNNPGERGLFTSQACCRCKAQGMQLWYFTANAL